MKNPSKSGIYRITNSQTGKVYIGSAVSTRARWNMHRSQLRKGAHHNAHLQAAWLKYGEESFAFSVMETVDDPADLLRKEDQWIATFSAADPKFGYNICKKAGSQLGLKHSDEARQKMSESHKGKVKSAEHQAAINESLIGRTLSDEHRAKIAAVRTGSKSSDAVKARLREANTNRREKLSPEAYERMVTANIGRKFSEEHKAKIAAANKKRTLSPETKAKISQARKRNEQMKKNSAQTEQPLMGYELRSKLAAEA